MLFRSAPSSDDFSIAARNFTADMWIRWNSLPTAGNDHCIFTRNDGAALYNYVFWLKNVAGTYKFGMESWNGSASAISWTIDSTGLSTGTWYHIAVVRSGSTFYVFQDGSQLGTATDADAFPTNAYTFYIGNLYGTRYLNGWIDDFRFSLDSARWTAAFTVPSSAWYD